jgi:hypothetical protein
MVPMVIALLFMVAVVVVQDIRTFVPLIVQMMDLVIQNILSLIVEGKIKIDYFIFKNIKCV